VLSKYQDVKFASWLPFASSFIRYAVSGVLAFITEYVSFYIMFEHFHVMLLLANGLSFCFGLLVAFLLNRIWVFGSHEYSKKTAHQFGSYVTLALINLFLTLGIVSLLKQLGVDPVVGKFIAMVITSSWNFLLLKFIIFRHARPPQSS